MQYLYLVVDYQLLTLQKNYICNLHGYAGLTQAYSINQ